MKLAHSKNEKYGALKFRIRIIFNHDPDSNQFLKKLPTQVYKSHFNACFSSRIKNIANQEKETFIFSCITNIFINSSTLGLVKLCQ